MGRDLGDFQTPAGLVDLVLRCVQAHGLPGGWVRALEPTCGAGSFIKGLLGNRTPLREIRGIEVQDKYLPALRALERNADGTKVAIQQGSVFEMDLRNLPWSCSGPLLVVGNPPWVTNAELGVLGSTNVPTKVNLKGLRGIDAITGGANFDIGEYIWIKLITELSSEEATIALLCKTSVARNVLEFAHKKRLPITSSWIRRIDARSWFGAAVDACLFCTRVGTPTSSYETPVYPDLLASAAESAIGFGNGRIVADSRRYAAVCFADGASPVVWRQGIKHDAAPVMELIPSDRGYRNRLGEPADVEPEHVYPLLKGSDLYRGDHGRPRYSVIVTQRFLGEDTRGLALAAPKLWEYLCAHGDLFTARKSSIYTGQHPFAMFGIGDYSFAPYKVAVSGLGKEPRFRALGPFSGRPVMLDDTCYFVPCSSPMAAALITSLLEDPACTGLLGALVFSDSKRPVTKRVLQRLDLRAILSASKPDALTARVRLVLGQLCPDARKADTLGIPPSEQWPRVLDQASGYGRSPTRSSAPGQQLALPMAVGSG